MKKILLVALSCMSLNVFASQGPNNNSNTDYSHLTAAPVMGALLTAFCVAKQYAALNINDVKARNPLTGKMATFVSNKELIEMTASILHAGMKSSFTPRKIAQAAGTSFVTEKIVALLSAMTHKLGISPNDLINDKPLAYHLGNVMEETARQNIKEALNATIDDRKGEYTFLSFRIEV